MYLKRFRSTNLRDALQRVREELGPNALVLSTAMVSAAGLRGLLGAREIEVTAAAERDMSETRRTSPEREMSEPRRTSSPPRHQLSLETRPRPSIDARPRPSLEPRPRPSLELRHRPSIDHNPAAALAARLSATGLDRGLSQEIADSLSVSSADAVSLETLGGALTARLASIVAPQDDEIAPVQVFVGPPGAGKTTTIAKIAAQERAHSGRRLGLIAADGFRMGAVEQLRAYADIVGSPFHVARTTEDLSRALAHERSEPTPPALPVLVDTAGRSPSDTAARELFELIAATPGIRTHLVMPAGTSPSAARRIFDAYADARPARVVLTKMDEVDSMSPLVKLLTERQVPISYLGTGQRVPEDLNRATAELVAASVLGETTIMVSAS